MWLKVVHPIASLRPPDQVERVAEALTCVLDIERLQIPAQAHLVVVLAYPDVGMILRGRVAQLAMGD